ncbi:MAG: O-antigen ligase family protein [Thermodesulfobacteriota bacterium]
MRAIDRFNNFIEGYGIIKILLPVFLFFQPFQHFAGVRNTSFILLLLIFLIRLFSGRTRIDFRDRTVQALIILAAVSLLSAGLSPYALESFHAIRKNLSYQVVIFLIIICEYRSLEEVRPLVYALLAGFAALTLLIIFNNRPEVILNWLDYTDKKYTRGYSLFATFYIPLAVAYLYSMRESLKVKYLITCFLFAEFILSVLNNHRGQIVAIVLSVAVLTLVARRFKVFVIGAAVCLVAGGVLLKAKPDMYDRYKTLLSPSTYLTNEYRGWNNRFAIWSGTVDMIKKRPVTGWGYGWKKIAHVARDGGYLERWDKAAPSYHYFKGASYGQANPHNLLLQLLFEIGFLGLLAFLLFWFTILVKAVSASGRSGVAADFLKYACTGVLLSYAIINVSNGLWEESIGMVIIAFAAIVLIAHRDMVRAG